jgi:hypothetical protein
MGIFRRAGIYGSRHCWCHLVVLGQELDCLGAQESYLGQAILCGAREARRLYRPHGTASPQEQDIEDT